LLRYAMNAHTLNGLLLECIQGTSPVRRSFVKGMQTHALVGAHAMIHATACWTSGVFVERQRSITQVMRRPHLSISCRIRKSNATSCPRTPKNARRRARLHTNNARPSGVAMQLHSTLQTTRGMQIACAPNCEKVCWLLYQCDAMSSRSQARRTGHHV